MRGVRSMGAVVAVATIATVVLPLVLPLARIPGPGTLLAGGVPAGLYLQVAAHPDDDLLFMSPDLLKLIARGASTVTVYLTAGESVAGMRDDHPPRGYAIDRQRGIRAAYAWVAGARDRWRRKLMVAGRIPVEVDTLTDAPRVQLIFAGLPDGGDPRADGGRGALTRLWADSTGRACVHAFLRRDACLSHDDVLDMLRTLMRTFRPTVLHILDPAPPPAGPDHPDHVAAARFAAEAAAVSADVEVIAYRGYTIQPLPPNLGPAEREVKRKAFAIYRQHDYRAGSGYRYDAWIERMYRRWPDKSMASNQLIARS
ncbi:PIG-L family deacetylase [Streptosporangium sp. NPDC051022]|uniref:PIG-L family deacetylase n=1 Tax=Streptosporangium sp. NPDC051022 TaxID=3155752 RepID=UPI0034478E39